MFTLEKQFDAATNACVMFSPAIVPIIAEGPDTSRYLQGRITQNIATLAPGKGAKSLLLSPQGRVLGQFTIFKREKDFLLLSEPAAAENSYEYFSDALLKFKVAD